MILELNAGSRQKEKKQNNATCCTNEKPTRLQEATNVIRMKYIKVVRSVEQTHGNGLCGTADDACMIG